MIRLLFTLLIEAASAMSLINGVGKLPTLGWNSWNAFECSITESQVLSAAQNLIDLGLKDAGYTYVNIDDCWNDRSRDPTTHRLQPDLGKFPDGIKGIASRVHNMGLKMGIYSSAGKTTCKKLPASLGYELIDAETWAEWQIDYLKLDDCGVPREWKDDCLACVPDSRKTHYVYMNGTCKNLAGNWCPSDYDFRRSKTYQRYKAMRDAILAQSRPMIYSICNKGKGGIPGWGNEIGHSWRSTEDIDPEWSRILEIINQNSFYMNHVNFYGRPDADMLEIGNGDLTLAESRSHFAFWAAMKSPLLIGTDLSQLSQEHIRILKNDVLLAFNQDDVYEGPAMPFKWDWTFSPTNPAEFWSGQFQRGILILLLNVEFAPRNMSVNWEEVPQLGDGSYWVTDGWTGESLGCLSDGIAVEVETHDTRILLVGNRCWSSEGRYRPMWWK